VNDGEPVLSGRAGRLVFTEGRGHERLDLEENDDAPPWIDGGEPEPSLLAIGWATVDLDRAAASFAPMAFDPAPSEVHLGAFARRPLGPGVHRSVILLEPSTEGRLAASLVRHGEGPAALYLGLRPGSLEGYLADARRRGTPTSPVAGGPLGPEVLVLGGPAAGPHVLVVDPGAGTIAS
jgi:hypothetical protein